MFFDKLNDPFPANNLHPSNDSRLLLFVKACGLLFLVRIQVLIYHARFTDNRMIKAVSIKNLYIKKHPPLDRMVLEALLTTV